MNIHLQMKEKKQYENRIKDFLTKILEVGRRKMEVGSQDKRLIAQRPEDSGLALGEKSQDYGIRKMEDGSKLILFM